VLGVASSNKVEAQFWIDAILDDNDNWNEAFLLAEDDKNILSRLCIRCQSLASCRNTYGRIPPWR